MPTQLFDPDTLEQVATGFAWVEGPAWLPHRGVLRFSDVKNNAVVDYDPATSTTRIVTDAAEFTNGRTVGPGGTVVECSHGLRALQIDDATGSTSADSSGDSTTPTRAATGSPAYAPRVLVDHVGPHRLNSPNDVVVRSDGSIWFTDPAYGIKRPEEGHGGDEEYGDRYVFRFDPADGSLTPVVIDVEAPNGLAFSPDEQFLYVSDTSLNPADADHPVPGRPRGHAIHAYDVVGGRHAKNGRVLAVIDPGVPDGFRVDVEGRIWTSSGSGIQVLGPDGTVLDRLPVPEVIANCCFGDADGRTLYICASTSIYRVRTTTTDARAIAYGATRRP
jgi:gluconolactonase